MRELACSYEQVNYMGKKGDKNQDSFCIKEFFLTTHKIIKINGKSSKVENREKYVQKYYNRLHIILPYKIDLPVEI